MENLNTLINNKIIEQKDIEHSIKTILNDLIKEVVLNNLVQEEKQRELMSYIMKRVEESPQLTEEKFSINDNVNIDPPDRPSSPIVFYQDDDIPQLICDQDDTECLKTKSILKPPRSPKMSSKMIRINFVPEVREIERNPEQEDEEPEESMTLSLTKEPMRLSVVEEIEERPTLSMVKETDESRSLVEKTEESLSTVEETEKERPTPAPAARKRSWAKVKELNHE